MRGIFTLLALALGSGAVVLWDCGSTDIHLFAADPFGVCATVEGMNVGELPFVAGVLGALAVSILTLTWLPMAWSAIRRRRTSPEKALIENIGRLGESSYEDLDVDVDHQPTGGHEVGELGRRIDVLESAFETDGADLRGMTSEWMSLLREANRLHNEGIITTEEFKVVNTRLLEIWAGRDSLATR